MNEWGAVSIAGQALIDSMDHGCHDVEWQGFPVRLIKQPWGELLISLHGAQVLHFRPANEHPVLWLTAQPKSFPGAIRGGVPLCWPWFADHPADAALPAHGVARTGKWRLEHEQITESGGCWLMTPEASLWPDLALSLRITVGQNGLAISLTTDNVGLQAATLTQALHSYLAISARNSISIEGLEGYAYFDKLQAMAQFNLEGSVDATQEIDRVFNHAESVLLVDHGWQRSLRIGKRYSGSTVVWNPGVSAKGVVDIGLDQVDAFVCIEAANTGCVDPVVLLSGESICLETQFTIEPYVK
ncbi:D-hexose-6-phosphate mutarotase [Neptunomonas antarctica]|uniref:Putative glucose-6-phosphate 1-epimerase n=1 Tax=Neptunomonas antarctica TaxID=619304 RepID=A0A1N7L1W7_9GAMM|nr:D-hexose-6-phosphate mutarotase [Neptunomonas antarctica]SIS67814.1 glucose-6-phosphate 1-epimerase [Neptunomonas antarctica]